MICQEESFFTGVQNRELYFQTWTPEKFTGHLIITHGHGEHSECYARFASAVADVGIKIWSWDLRGHGRSQGARGAVPDFYLYTQDYEIFLNNVVGLKKISEPVILMGHSMGGLIQLKTLIGHTDLKKYPQILSAPWLGLSLEVPAWKKKASKLMFEFFPEVTLSNELSFENLSTDPEVLESYRRDPYRHQKISAGAFEPALVAAEDVIQQAQSFKAPLLVFASDKDPVVSTSKIKEFYENVPFGKKSIRLFHNRKHEVLNDKGREEAIALVREFISQQLSI